MGRGFDSGLAGGEKKSQTANTTLCCCTRCRLLLFGVLPLVEFEALWFSPSPSLPLVLLVLLVLMLGLGPFQIYHAFPAVLIVTGPSLVISPLVYHHVLFPRVPAGFSSRYLTTQPIIKPA